MISVEHFERLRLVCFDDQWSSIIARLTAMLTLTITRGQSRILLDVVRLGIELRLELKVRHDVVRQFAASVVRRTRKCFTSHAGDKCKFTFILIADVSSDALCFIKRIIVMKRNNNHSASQYCDNFQQIKL